MRCTSIIFCIALVAIPLLLIGCDRQPSAADYVATQQSGINSLPWAGEMDKHFGRKNVDHFITYYGRRNETLIWNSEVHYGGRFVLTLQVPVNVNYHTNTVTAAGQPKFFLHAVSQVDQLPDGRFSASFAGDLQRHFDLPLWNQFVAQNFDLTVLQIPQNEQRQIVTFDQYVGAVRGPRLSIP